MSEDRLAEAAWLDEFSAGSGNRDGHGSVAATLLARLEAAERLNAQLQQALDSRVVIEQAKGVLAERYQIGVERAFEVLRRAARTSRTRIHALAAGVVGSRQSPPAIVNALVQLEGASRRD